MCDELTAADNDRALAAFSRREFGAGVAAAAAVIALPIPANAFAITGRDVVIKTPDGECDAYFVAPAGGKHPAVLVWPDIMGLRPAFRQMADRLAQSGYAVLTVNPFYRSAKAPYHAPGDTPDSAKIREQAFEWRKLITADAAVRDAIAFIAFIDKQKETDTKRGVGTTGYCMGGPLTMRTAAAVPNRVRAGASFHGGGLATDAPDSPHLLVPKMKASYLFAVAANDDERNPAEKEKVREAFAAAKLPAEIEVYAGANHGWCPPDSRAYNQAQAERAWERLLVLLKGAL
ncbi:dienelactone hydrolase family protein [Sphingomonas sp. G-3-2-10]|uniref:dienelactone hydrolase family protein n=1 Tax=Sphingomonas sp. G-3-2-10 TaxID=2728838 RepID=UPI00146F51DB|nr:dienelactone hydrolase family protein [Sphingomonas sp. G-3-2-10]NML06502.1 dienelactone hydrolase family protein [Sphingomonas sp. G-3-2-10]